MVQNQKHFNGIDYVCECGKHFAKKRSLTVHARFCSQYIKEKKRSNYWRDNLQDYLCECGYTTENYQSLNAHFRQCEQHHLALYNEPLGDKNRTPKGCMQGWENKTADEIKQFHKKAGKTMRTRIYNGELIPSFSGKSHTEETKQKIRETTISNIQKLHGKCRANYSEVACKYIDKLNIDKGWHLVHALNGGEKFIAGYFLDGYDANLNIAFEYDEPKHYQDIEKNILKQKDITRQENIINTLHCEFWRYNESLKRLYKVN